MIVEELQLYWLIFIPKQHTSLAFEEKFLFSVYSLKSLFISWFISFLGFKKDEIDFFTNENPTPVERAKNLLQIWFEDDEDASMDNLLYILEGLGMNEAAEAVRNEISNPSES